MRLLFPGLLFILLSIPGFSRDTAPFQVKLVPVEIPGFEGLQSFAWAREGNKILLVGGRTDGLHQKQPFAAFRPQYNNTRLIVLDLATRQVWSRALEGLRASMVEQLQSTNMEFYQKDKWLVCTGGYGYSDTEGTHITHPYITVLELPALIEAIIQQKDISPFIRQLQDERMAVTGGRLDMLDDVYYLVGGQRFDGRYNPHGPDHGPGFYQQYTNEVRKFRLDFDGREVQIKDYTSVYDSLLLHRRDYNLLPQKSPEGKRHLTIYSGVFQYDKDAPYTSLVDVDAQGVKELPDFAQRFSHYHSATLAMWDEKTQTSSAMFFGGIASQYPDKKGKIVTDENVPFVKTISLISRQGREAREYVLETAMPGYLGASAEFVPVTGELFKEGFLEVGRLGATPVLAGHIIGGIRSDDPNIFWPNTQGMSTASPVIFEVRLSLTP